MDSLKNSPSLDSDSPKENHPLTEPTQQSVPPTESTQQSAIDESEVDHDTEISLEKTKNANQALSTIEDSGFFTQSHYSFLILTSVTEEIGTNLLELLDEKYTHVRKSFYLHKAVLTLKLPSFTNSAPHAWFFQQLLQWSFNGQLTQAEARRVRVMASPLVTAQSPGYVYHSQDNPATGHPTVVMEVGFGQSYSSLVQAVRFWLEGVGVNVRKVIMIRFSRRESGVAGTIELWGRDATGNARMIWSNRIFPVRGPVERPIYLTREDIFDGVVEPGRQGTDCLDFDLTSLRDMITEMGLNTVGLIPAP
ncbi:uncharacterized protein N7518_010230 [Penicillium psychrosexuale]|uniref:uncharacterized protein n=1 Tax=Penicillium psychrosexuale TaxID=1002107 RepID=UPI0025457FD7|nr:uncharacterized protein N7518_010230 [Penicillium psychrosexuale]KAJ5781747.1 hypothetical protein N7518_010230 [Penicillium psychrosexuale]